MLIVYPFLVALYEKEKLMDKLKFVFFALTIALSTTALAATYYQEAPNKTKKIATSSKPIITSYTGRIVASKYRDKKGTLSFNCPQGVVNFTSMEWPHKIQTSAQFVYGGGSSTIRGKLNKESKVFEGDLKSGEYVIIHMKGAIKEDRAEGSVWIEIVNFPVYNTNGLCVGNFIAYPSR
jgi:hypothetical protein